MSFFTRVRPDRDTPLLIVFGIAFSYFAVAIAGMVLVIAIADLLLPIVDLPFMINGREGTAAELLLTGGPSLVLIIAFFLAVGWGLQRHRRWVRYLILAYHVISTAVIVMTEGANEEVYAFVFQGCLLLAFSAWYFFGKKNVVAYFSDQPPETSPSKPIRPIGITLLTILLVSQAGGGIGNGIILFTGLPYPFAHLKLLGSILLIHGAISTAAVVGVWKLRSWALQIIAAWAASLTLSAVVMMMCMPETMAEHVSSLLLTLYAVFTLGIGLLIYSYVRRTIPGDEKTC